MTLFVVTFERRHRCSGQKSPGNAMRENPNGIQSIPKTRARYDEALRLPSAFAAHRLQSRSDSQPVSLAPPRNDIRIFSRVPRCCLGNAEGYRSTRGHVSITITSRPRHRWLTLRCLQWRCLVSVSMIPKEKYLPHHRCPRTISFGNGPQPHQRLKPAVLRVRSVTFAYTCDPASSHSSWPAHATVAFPRAAW